MTYEEALNMCIFGQRINGKNYYLICDEWFNAVDKALEKQIPHKVDMTKFYGGALCPSCGELFEKYMDNWKSPYCQYCGVKLDWNEEEE